MTEQPAEPTTEQEWIGPFRVPIRTKAEQLTEQEWLKNGTVELPAVPLQHYAPNAHRGLAQGGRVTELGTKERSGLATKFLGAIDAAFDKADRDLTGRRATDAGLRCLDADVEADIEAAGRKVRRRPSLELQAEMAAACATDALSSGELDEGIAWLQSALAMAQNHRHATRHEGTVQ